jgi:hypothetical protein
MKCIKIEYPVTQIKKNRKEDMPRRPAGQPDAADAAAAAPAGPGMQGRITELRAMLAAGEITQGEFELARANILGLGAAPAGVVPAGEPPEKKHRRELMALIQKWIGSKELPALGEALYDAIVVGTGDEGLRRQVAALTTKSRLTKELTAVFKATPKGETPPQFVGAANEAMRFARLAARKFLLGLAAALAVSQANKHERLSDDERKMLTKETLGVIDDDESAANSGTVLANLKVSRANSKTFKRLREDAESSSDDSNRKPAQARKSKSREKYESKNREKYAGNMSSEKRTEMMKQGLCFVCGKKGHVSAACPTKK